MATIMSSSSCTRKVFTAWGRGREQEWGRKGKEQERGRKGKEYEQGRKGKEQERNIYHLAKP